jgi:hypothetical protein
MLYHGSKFLIKNYLEPHSSRVINNEKAVFASPSKSFVLAFMGDKWSDNDFELGEIDGILFMVEKKPNVFSKYLDKKEGYLYTMSNKNFHSNQRLGMKKYEFISDKKVKILKTKKINNVLDALKKSKIKLIKYNQIDFIHLSDKILKKLDINYSDIWKKVYGINSNKKIENIGIVYLSNKIKHFILFD